MAIPQFNEVTEPEWAALAAYLRQVAAAGDVVQVSARPEGLTPNQFASRMGMSRSTVMRLIESKQVSAYKVGSHWRVPLAELDRYRRALNQEMLAGIADDLEAALNAG